MELIDYLTNAVAFNRVHTVTSLLEQGAPIDGLDAFGEGALHYAAKTENVELIALLIEKGANVDQLNSKHETPLHAATMQGSGLPIATSPGTYEAIKLLLGKGATINAMDEKTREATRERLKTYINFYSNLHKTTIEPVQQKYSQESGTDGFTDESYKSLLLAGVSLNDQMLSGRYNARKDQVASSVAQWLKPLQPSEQEDSMVGPSFKK